MRYSLEPKYNSGILSLARKFGDKYRKKLIDIGKHIL